MKKTLFSLIAVAAISTSAGMSAQAQEVVVKKGDTLYSLSTEHAVSIDHIKELNDLSSDMIYAGETLTVSSESNDSSNTYVVEEGDTLWGIANKLGVSVSQLKSLNNLSGDIIYPKQVISAAGAAENNQQAAAVQGTSTTESTAKPAASVNTAQGKSMTVTATAYTAYCEGCSGVTATGVDLRSNPNQKVIAVDPSVIPLGSKVYVEGYGVATAADTGGAIKGNRIDVFIPTESGALDWGRKTVNIEILQ